MARAFVSTSRKASVIVGGIANSCMALLDRVMREEAVTTFRVNAREEVVQQLPAQCKIATVSLSVSGELSLLFLCS